MRRSIVTCAGLGATVTGMMLLAAAPALAHGEAGEGDLVLTVGAGDVTELASHVLTALGER